VGTQRAVTVRVEPAHDGALRSQARPGLRVVDRPDASGHGRVARPRLEREHTLARRGDEGLAAQLGIRAIEPPEPLEARRGPARARPPRPRRAWPAACRRCRAARRPRGPRASPAAARGGAARSSPPARPAAGRRARPRRRARRPRRPARPPPTSSRPVAESPGTSLAEWTARSISPSTSAPSSAPVQRDLSPAARLRSPCGRHLDELAADPLGDPPGLGERQRAAAGADPQGAQRAAGGADLGAAVRPRPPAPARRARRARAAPAGACGGAGRLRVRSRSVGSCSSRLRDGAGDASTRSRSRSVSAPSARRSREHRVDDLVAARAQRRHGRQHLERAEPAREGLDLLLDDAPRPARLGLRDRPRAATWPGGRRRRRARRPRARRRRDRCRAGPRGRSAAAGRPRALHHLGELLGPEQGVRRGGGADDDVGAGQLGGQLVEGERVPAEALASACARSRRRLATKSVRTPWVCSARAVPSAVSRRRRSGPAARRGRQHSSASSTATEATDAWPSEIRVCERTRLPVASAARKSLLVSGRSPCGERALVGAL
jgi:hypothetical protein